MVDFTGPCTVNVLTIYELSVCIFSALILFITFPTDNSNTTTIAIGVVVAIIGVLINIVIVVIILVVRRGRNSDIKTLGINAAEIPVQERYGAFYSCKMSTYLAFKCTTI